MTVYIEEFIIENILINLCLLRLITLTTKHHTTTLKLILSSFVGALFSVLVGITIHNILIVNILKVLCATTMLIIAYKQTFKQFFFNFILLYIFTYSFGGAIISLSYRQTSIAGFTISNHLTLMYITLILIVFTYIFELVLKNIKNRIKTNNYIYEIMLQTNKNKISLNAYMDSGNLLNFNGNPVIVIDLNYALKLLKISLADFLIMKTSNLNCGTVNGSGNLKIIQIQNVQIKKDNKLINLSNQYIGVNLSSNFKNTTYKALISPLYI